MARVDGDIPRKTFAEFFAGIGLVHLGLRPGGWRCVYANDIEPKKQRMYVDHFGPASYYHVEDIWNADAVMHRLAEGPFLATASFPCVDLSLAGHWRGFDGQHSSTYFGFLEIIRRLGDRRPRLILIENVYGFLTSRRGRDFERAATELADLGYWLDAIVLDARWFVPQSRPRTFLFGFHESMRSPRLIRRESEALFGGAWSRAVQASAAIRPDALRSLMDRVALPTGWATLDLSPPTRRAYRLLDVLDVDDGQAWWSGEETRKHYEMMEPPSRLRVDAMVDAKATAVGTAFRRTRRGRPRTEARFDLAGCLRTPKGGSAKQIVVAIVDGRLRMRWMSAIEYARLQGAPTFRIQTPPLQAMYGFGDAVCVPAIEWIDRHILTPLHESVAAEPTSSSAPVAAC